LILNENFVNSLAGALGVDLKDGVKSIAVVTPSFTVDCLETIVEIDGTLRDIFMQNGGAEMVVLPCLNAFEPWVDGFCKIVSKCL